MTRLYKKTVKITLCLLVCLLMAYPLVSSADDNQQTRTSTGVISTMKGWEIGIDEVLYQYSAETIFYDQNRQVISSGYFGKGTRVGIRWYIDGREFRVTEVWKTK